MRHETDEWRETASEVWRHLEGGNEPMNRPFAQWLWGVGIVGVGASAVVGLSLRPHAAAPFSSAALFSDETPQFVTPAEPAVGQSFQVKLRTGADQVQSAYVVVNGLKIAMTKSGQSGRFDMFVATVPGQTYRVRYYFSFIDSSGKQGYYSGDGYLPTEPSPDTAFQVVPGFQTPSWALGTVFYQIFPDRFYNGDPTNDDVTDEFMYDGAPDVHQSNWSQPPDPTGYPTGNRTREFYGGDLQGIIDKLPYLKGLGVDALYLTPIFVAPSNHKYDTQDYSHVDPHLGKIVQDGGNLVNPALGEAANAHATKYIERTENPANLAASDAVLQDLITKAHADGIKVILDGVFNHSGSFNQWFDKEHIYPNTPPTGPGAYESQNSPFHDFYAFNSNHWPNNEDYDGWQDIKTLPKLNYAQSPTLVHDIYSIASKWVSAPYNADGWRLDSAGDLGYSDTQNQTFWNGFRTAVRTANPNALILAEYYQDPILRLDGQSWDSLQNYAAFLQPVSRLLTGMEEHSSDVDPNAKGNVQEFLTNITQNMSSFPYPAMYSAMNALDNHDISRFLTRTNGVPGGDDSGNTPSQADAGVHPDILEQGAILQMTWPGSATVYYGDEAGVTGWTDPDSRRTFPWGRENMTLETFYHQVIAMHNDYSCFETGSMYVFQNMPEHVLAYGRFDDKSAGVTLMNLGHQSETLTIPVWELQTQDGSSWTIGSLEGSVLNMSTVQTDGNITVTLAPGAACTLVTKVK